MHLLSCTGFSRFSESVTYYLANVEGTSHNDIRQNTFEGEMLSAYEILFNVWIKSSEAKVLYRIVGLYVSCIRSYFSYRNVVVVERNFAHALDDKQFGSSPLQISRPV